MSSLTLIRGLCLRQSSRGTMNSPPRPWNPASASVHVASPQVLPFPAHCGPWLPPRFLSVSRTEPNKRGTPERGGEEENSYFRIESEISPEGRKEKHTMQRLLLYSGHSINQLWNKSWRGIQRATAEKGKGVTVISKDVRKLGFLCSCLSHLLQLWLENAVRYCVITLSNGTCPATHTRNRAPAAGYCSYSN